jgi:hypothetical protein
MFKLFSLKPINMGLKKSYLVIVPFFMIFSVFGQNAVEILPAGARSIGMANTGLTHSDAWSIFNNPGSLARLQHSKMSTGYDHRFQLNELTTIHAGLTISRSKYAIGLGASSFGGEEYNQRNLALVFSHQLGITSLGIKVNYLQTSIEGFGRSANPVVEIGGVAELSPNLLFGAHIYNPIPINIDKTSENNLPIFMKVGLAFLINEKVNLNTEVEKDLLLPPLVKVGLEYQVLPILALRIGAQPQQKNIFYGLGFSPSRFEFHLASGQNLNLGRTFHFSLSYRI